MQPGKSSRSKMLRRISCGSDCREGDIGGGEVGGSGISLCSSTAGDDIVVEIDWIAKQR